jgi:hypothetical protein
LDGAQADLRAVAGRRNGAGWRDNGSGQRDNGGSRRDAIGKRGGSGIRQRSEQRDNRGQQMKARSHGATPNH